MKQSLVDRGDGEKLIGTNVGDVHSMDSRLQLSEVVYGLDFILLIKWKNSKS